MSHAPVGDVGDVQQAVDTAQIDERAVFGEVLDHAGYHRAFRQMFQRDRFADRDLFLHGRLARDHHVAAAAIQLDDFDRDILAHQGIEIVDRARVGLRAGHECLDPHIHRQAALDAPQHAAGNHQLLLIGLFQVVPDAQARGARVREQDVPFGLLAAVVDHHIDGVSRLHRDFAAGPLKLFDRNQPFGLVSEIDDDVFGGKAEHRALQDLIRGGRREMAVIVEKILVVVRDFLVGLFVVRVYGHYASASH